MNQTNHIWSCSKVCLVCLTVILINTSFAQYRNIYKESAWKERDKWQKPDEIIKALKITETSKVADIGCHQGYMTIKLAGIVGKQGEVFAVDVNSYQLRKLKDNLKERKLTQQVTIIHGQEDNPKLPLITMDAILIMDTYHEFTAYKEMLLHIKNALKPGGRLVIVEPIADNRIPLARSQQKDMHEIAIRYVIEDLKEAGFELLYDVTPFVDRSEIKGDKMWMLVAKKPRD